MSQWSLLLLTLLFATPRLSYNVFTFHSHFLYLTESFDGSWFDGMHSWLRCNDSGSSDNAATQFPNSSAADRMGPKTIWPSGFATGIKVRSENLFTFAICWWLSLVKYSKIFQMVNTNSIWYCLRFRRELASATEEIARRNENRNEYYKYTCLDPKNLPNSINIWSDRLIRQTVFTIWV